MNADADADVNADAEFSKWPFVSMCFCTAILFFDVVRNLTNKISTRVNQKKINVHEHNALRIFTDDKHLLKTISR